MKTTHQLARELLSLPDVEVVLEGSCHAEDYEIGAKLTSYDENKAIVMMIDQMPIEDRKEYNRKMEEKFPTEMVWTVFESTGSIGFNPLEMKSLTETPITYKQ